jgi:hypothetical protein
MSRRKVSLNGPWDFCLPDLFVEKRKVPGSYICVGDSSYIKRFQAEPIKLDERIHLVLEGIAYEGEVIFNKKNLGHLYPYSRYSFDITDIIKPDDNELIVNVKDINADFGPNDGWENYSGLIWDVYLEYTPAVYISDFIWRTTFEDNYAKAHCALEVYVCNTLPHKYEGEAAVKLRFDKNCATALNVPFAVEAGEVKSVSLPLDIENPNMWSPESPNLYDLAMEIRNKGNTIDAVTHSAGFKDFKVSGKRFYLNGKPCFLKGICRHDLWEGTGHTLTKEQIETDMLGIKSIGCNYVRLVHYPHNKYAVELADKIGLLVSGEPGLWWEDLNYKPLTTAALAVTKKLVERDRNNVSVAFWLTLNECVFVDDYLREAYNICKKLDPTRPVSCANCMSADWTKETFNRAGYDFYTFHPYGTTFNTVNTGHAKEAGFKGFQTLENILTTLDDKPVIFTEWGGMHMYNNPEALLKLFLYMKQYARNNEDGPVLAGFSYWLWADYPMVNRDRSTMIYQIGEVVHNGILSLNRTPSNIYAFFARAMQNMDLPPVPKPSYTEVYEYVINKADRFQPVDIFLNIGKDIQKQAYEKSLERAARIRSYYLMRDKRHLDNGPVLQEDISCLGDLPVQLKAGRPIVVNDVTGNIVVKINQKVEKLYVIGQAGLFDAYPFYKPRGEVMGKYVLLYADGSKTEIPLRNGIEICSILGIQAVSRLDPRATNTKRVLKVVHDENYGIYYINSLVLDTKADVALKELQIHACDELCTIALYGITVQLK